MEKAWVNDDPHAKFWRRLLNQRVTQLVNSKSWLQSLRYKNEGALVAEEVRAHLR